MNILKLTLITLAVASLLLFSGCRTVGEEVADISGNWYITMNYDSTANTAADTFTHVYLWTITQNGESGTISWYFDDDVTDTVAGNNCLAGQFPFEINKQNYLTVNAVVQLLACAGPGSVSATFQGTGHAVNLNLNGTFIDPTGKSSTVQISGTRF